MKKKQKKVELPFGYICPECAKELGAKWPKNHCVTFHQAECPYCQETKGLCAVTDYLWNGEKRLRIWD